jgi:hypothetical protein
VRENQPATFSRLPFSGLRPYRSPGRWLSFWGLLDRKKDSGHDLKLYSCFFFGFFWLFLAFSLNARKGSVAVRTGKSLTA